MRKRIALLILGLCAISVSLPGCFDRLFGPDPDVSGLTVTEPSQQSDGGWTVLISVRGMSEGIAGILIEEGGLVTENVHVGTLVASGANGFLVTAQAFDDAPAQATLVAVCPTGAVTDGKVLKLTFRSSGGDPEITLDPSHVILANDRNEIVTP